MIVVKHIERFFIGFGFRGAFGIFYKFVCSLYCRFYFFLLFCFVFIDSQIYSKAYTNTQNGKQHTAYYYFIFHI